MNKENVTCIQRVKVVFPLRHKNLYSFFSRKKKHKANRLAKHTDLKNSFHLVTKCSQMMKLLQNTHPDWLVFRTKKRLIMETTTFDFSKVIETLSNNGFSESDYRLEVEYERKWGML